jgi:hypothetical protein
MDTVLCGSLISCFVVISLKPELIKVTHKHCYPDTGDVRIGKLAVGSSPSSLRVILLCTWIALLFALLVRPHICLQNLVPFFWPFCSRFA